MIKSINFTLGLVLFITGCTPVSQSVETSSEVVVVNSIVEKEPFTQPVMSNYSVDATEANKMIQSNPELVILDVRTPAEIPIDGKIANSIMIPLQVLGQYIHRLDKSKTILVYCHTGNRSLVAMQILHDNGFNVIDMAGGISSWTASGLPVER